MDEIINLKTVAPAGSTAGETPETLTRQRTKVNILWTGGMDSTFRMLQLSMMETDIQPYYLVDKRISEKHELKAISFILKEIEKHPLTKGNILPLKKFNVSGLEEDKQVYEAYQRLYNKHSIGSQYEWLSRFSRIVPGIELGKEKSENCKLTHCLQKEATLVKIEEGILSYYIVDREKSNPDMVTVFGQFRFPDPLIETTKLQMVDLCKEWGYGKVMDATWFCHSPINNQPCGICNPCMGTMLEGLTFRFSAAAIKRFNNKMKYGDTQWFRFYMKLRLKLTSPADFKFSR